MNPGERIKHLLKQKKISQRQLANVLGLKEQHLSKMLNGTIQTIPPEILTQIGHILDVDAAYFLGWRHEDYSPNYEGVSIPIYNILPDNLQDIGLDHFVTTESISNHEARVGKYFGVILEENDPSLNLMKGDTIIIRKQDSAKPEDIVAALNIQNSKTQKKIARYSSLINKKNASIWKQDQPAKNPEDDDNESIKIIGKCIEIRRKL